MCSGVLVVILFARARADTLTFFRLAMLQRLSPFPTVYVVTGVTPATGWASSAPAAGAAAADGDLDAGLKPVAPGEVQAIKIDPVEAPPAGASRP